MKFTLKIYSSDPWRNKVPPLQDTYEYLVSLARRRLAVETAWAEIRDLKGTLRWSGYVDGSEIVEAIFPGPQVVRTNFKVEENSIGFEYPEGGPPLR